MKLSIRPVSDPQLSADLSNLDLIRLPAVKKELSGERAQLVRASLIQQMLDVVGHGGVDRNNLPTPIIQSGFQCQTCALLNGIQAVASHEKITTLAQQIDQLRDRAVGTSGAFSVTTGESVVSQETRFSMDAVAQVLKRDGIISIISCSGTNPIQVIRELFTPLSFLGVSDASSWHAFAVVPLKDPTQHALAIKIDSLGGRQTVLSAEQFLDLIVRREVEDHHAIYRVLT